MKGTNADKIGERIAKIGIKNIRDMTASEEMADIEKDQQIYLEKIDKEIFEIFAD
jgi:hypothetical protein